MATTSSLLNDKPPRPRRRIPLSLRICVAILMVFGLAGFWRCLTAYRQMAAIRELERLGGSFGAEPVGPTWLRDVVGRQRMEAFDEVTGIVFTRATDSTLSHIARLRRPKMICLRDSQVTDAGLAHLCSLTSLECLDLANTKVSADGLAILAALPNLKILWLDETQANDAGRQHLRNLTELKWLVVDKLGAIDAHESDPFVPFLMLIQQKYIWEIGKTVLLDEGLAVLSRTAHSKLTIARQRW